jgi:hypothetical protein
LGKYLDRKVVLASPESMGTVDLSNSVVLVPVDEFSNALHARHAITQALEKECLAIFVCGLDAEQAFDFLIRKQSELHPTRHTMTRSFVGRTLDCVGDFLTATWPSEDRFEEWSSYTIVVPHSSALKEPLVQSIRGFLDPSEQ